MGHVIPAPLFLIISSCAAGQKTPSFKLYSPLCCLYPPTPSQLLPPEYSQLSLSVCFSFFHTSSFLHELSVTIIASLLSLVALLFLSFQIDSLIFFWGGGGGRKQEVFKKSSLQSHLRATVSVSVLLTEAGLRCLLSEPI